MSIGDNIRGTPHPTYSFLRWNYFSAQSVGSVYNIYLLPAPLEKVGDDFEILSSAELGTRILVKTTGIYHINMSVNNSAANVTFYIIKENDQGVSDLTNSASGNNYLWNANGAIANTACEVSASGLFYAGERIAFSDDFLGGTYNETRITVSKA